MRFARDEPGCGDSGFGKGGSRLAASYSVAAVPTFANYRRMWATSVRTIPTFANGRRMWATSEWGTSKAEAGAELAEGCELLELLVGNGYAEALLQLGLQLHASEAIEMQVAVESGIVIELCRLGASDGGDESGQRIGRDGGDFAALYELGGDPLCNGSALDFPDGGAGKVELRP